MDIVITNKLGTEFAVGATNLAARINSAAFVRFYDGAAVRPDCVMTALDWSVSTLLQAPIRRYSPLVDLVADEDAHWKSCNSALTALGNDVPLHTDAADNKRDAVRDCFEAFMRPSGIGPSIAAKTLHKKRPMLVPVIDDYIVRVLAGPQRRQLTPLAITDIIFDSFKPLVVRNLAALQEVRSELDNKGMTDARILDIAIWFHADQNRGLYSIRQ